MEKWRYLLAAPPNEIGDALAGFAGALAFVWIIVTVAMQSLELSDQRRVFEAQKDEFADQNRNLQKQIFENTFSNLISTLGEIIEAIDLTNSDRVTTRGRDCFKIYYERLKRTANKNNEGKPFVVIRTEFFESTGYEFGHYFRFLYNVYRFLDESDHAKIEHFRIVRAIISDYELLLLFYNCQTADGEKFKRYIEKYAIFDNMPCKDVIELDHLNAYAPSAFGENGFYNVWKGRE